MANPKLKTWKRTSLAAHTSPETIKRQAQDYLVWLATARGWLAMTERCSKCSGSGRVVSTIWRRRRSIYVHNTCPVCDGVGHVATCDGNGVPDIARAQAYCDAMDRRTLISETHAEPATKADKADKAVRPWRLKSKWWKPVPLTQKPFTYNQLREQARAYRRWQEDKQIAA